MTTEAPETAGELVATPSPDAGKTVWCENGCGNRILAVDERIPFPCPTGCGGMMSEERPRPVQGKTVSVELPTVGRIVHVLIAPNTVRPAIVMGREADGRLFVHVFKNDRDPSPPGLYDNDGVVRYGTHVGGWFWPPQAKKELFEAAIPDDE